LAYPTNPIYKLFKNVEGIESCIFKEVNGSRLCIPFSEDNSDYQEYLQWKADGNEPEAAEDSVKTN
jgi:hypothetical protein